MNRTLIVGVAVTFFVPICFVAMAWWTNRDQESPEDKDK